MLEVYKLNEEMQDKTALNWIIYLKKFTHHKLSSIDFWIATSDSFAISTTERALLKSEITSATSIIWSGAESGWES